MNQAETKRRQAEAFSDILMLITISIIGKHIGDEGIAYLAVAAESCALLWIALSGCLSDALGRLLRSRKNKGQYRNSRKMQNSVIVFQAAAGLVGSLLLLLAASGIAKAFKMPHSGLILMVLSRVVLLRSVSAVLTGCFQGEGSEFPRAVSGILRQIFLCGFGVLFGHILGSYGEKVSSLLRQKDVVYMYGGMGVAIGIVLAELLVLLFLGLIYKVSRNSEKRARQEGMYSTDSVWECIGFLHNSRWPQLMTEFLLFLPVVLGLLFLTRSAEDEGGMALEYGLYAGKYLVVCGVCAALIFIAVLPTIGKVFLSFKREETRFARMVFQSGAHICLVHGVFLAVFIAVMSGQMAGLLSEANAGEVAKMLQGGSAVVAFVALSGYFGRLLHVVGKRYQILTAACAADTLFLVVVLPTMGKIGGLSLVYGGVAGAAVFCVLLGALSFRQMRVKVDWLGMLVVPLGAGGVAGLICLLMGKLLSPQLGNLVMLLVAFAVSGAAYWVLLLLLRNFKEQELEAISGGRLIGMLGQLLRVYR